MANTLKSILSFLRAISRDATANTLAISAAAMMPLLALVGGGVDASRFYMADTRLQQACDAGALAARRAMGDSGFNQPIAGSTQTPKEIGDAFFEENFADGSFGIKDLTHNYAVTQDDEVIGTASGTLPTSIMGIFGFQTFNLNVTCTSDINISNTDIMFVIDITGSMNCAPDNPGGGNCGNSPDPGSKIEGLQEAMMLFFDTVEDATSPNAQVRYGVVPYASNVNVGRVLLDANPDWLAKSHTYQSRRWESFVGDWETSTEYVRYSGANSWDIQSTFTENLSFPDINACQNYVNGAGYIDRFISSNPSTWTLTSQSGSNPRVTRYDGDVIFEGRFFRGGTYNWSTQNCSLDWEITHYLADATITVTEEREVVNEWVYEPVTFDLTTLYDDNRIQLPLGNNGSMTNVNWDGCIEEANTVSEASFAPIPAGANDLNINLVPDEPSEYWKPVLRNAVWERRDGSGISSSTSTNTGRGDRTTATVRESERINANGVIVNQSRPGYDCTTEAFRLREMERADMQAFVDGLSARGNTYHDIGMIWGARLISPRGIFSAANATAPNGDAISRHIVFMTDGLLAPNIETYGMYGVEWWDRRITDDGGNNQASQRHAARFQAACRAARLENISVWVVAFGTELSQNLIDCATPGRAFQANDTAALRAQFEQIAQQIAALRLTS
jgi:hypothetical protein